MSLTILGSLGLDTIETPTAKVSNILGGNLSHACISASLLPESTVNIISITGDDFSDENLSLFESKGINISGVSRVKDISTFCWHAKYRTIHSEPEEIKVDNSHYKLMTNYKIPKSYHYTDILFLAAVSPSVQLQCLSKISLDKDDKLVAIDTNNSWAKKYPKEIKQVIAKSDILFINQREIKELTGQELLHSAVRQVLAERNLKCLIVKIGEFGAHLYYNNQCYSIPAFPVDDIVDPTGAGDSFAGSFLSYLDSKKIYSLGKNSEIEHNILKEALLYANIIASFSIEKFGVESVKEISLKQIQQRIESYKNFYNIEFYVNICEPLLCGSYKD